MNKTKRIFVAALALVIFTCALLAGCTPSGSTTSHVHELEKVEAHAATCSKSGNREYYVCVVCDETFADEEGAMSLSKEKYIIPAKGHKIAVHSEKNATCTVPGIKEYYECRNCGTLFNDANGMFMIMEAPSLPTLSHEIVKVNAKPSVGFTAGWLEHYACIHCNALYKDQFGLVATSMSEIKIAPVLTDFEYKIAFTPAANLVQNDYITAAYVDGANGYVATEFTIAAGAPAGTETYAWINQTVRSAMDAGINLRIPTYSGVKKLLELNVTNKGTEEVSFQFLPELNGKKEGVSVTIGAGESKTVKFEVSPGGSPGCNYVLMLTSGVSSETKLVLNGFYHCEGEVESVTLHKTAKKTTFKVGESFTAEGVILRAHGTDYEQVVIINYLTDIEEGYVFTTDDVGTRTVTVAYGEYTVTYDITVTA